MEVGGRERELREEAGRVWDLKEGEEEGGGEREEDEEGVIGRGKEEETSLPSFS